MVCDDDELNRSNIDRMIFKDLDKVNSQETLMEGHRCVARCIEDSESDIESLLHHTLVVLIERDVAVVSLREEAPIQFINPTVTMHVLENS